MAQQADARQDEELLLQALESRRNGIRIYAAALRAARSDALRREWEQCLSQTLNHELVLTNVFHELALDTEKQSPGRQVVAHAGKALVRAIEMAIRTASPAAAERVASECVVLAGTRDHHNRELTGRVAKQGEHAREQAA